MVKCQKAHSLFKSISPVEIHSKTFLKTKRKLLIAASQQYTHIFRTHPILYLLWLSTEIISAKYNFR